MTPDDRGALFARIRNAAAAADGPATIAEARRAVKDKAPASADPVAASATEKPAPVPRLDVTYQARPPRVRIRLEHPVMVEGHRLGEVALWSPVTGDVEDVVAGRMTRADLVAAMAGLPRGFLSALRFSDAETVLAIALVIAPEFEGAR